MRRHYPACCTSALCGACGDACIPCPNKPALDKFKAWVVETGATCDEIWSPLIYTAKEAN